MLIPLVVGVAVDGAQVGFRERRDVHLAVHEQLLAHEDVVNHEDGDGVEEGAVLVIVALVAGEGLGIVLDVLGHDVGTVVPEVGVLDGVHLTAHAHSVQLALVEGHQGGGDGQGVEVEHVAHAVIDQGVVVRCLDADGVLEEVAVAVELQGLGLVHSLDGLKVLLRAGDHHAGHGAVAAGVLVPVEDVLQAGQPVLGGALGHLVAVDVHPDHVVPELKGPSLALVRGIPLLGDAGDELAAVVDLQQAGDAVGQVVQVAGALAVQGEEGLHLSGSGLIGDEVLDGLTLVVGDGFGGGLRGGGRGLSVGGGRGSVGGVGLFWLAATAAGGEDHHGRKQQSQQSGSLFLHRVSLLSKNITKKRGISPDSITLARWGSRQNKKRGPVRWGAQGQWLIGPF